MSALRRAAKAGRKELRRVLPPALFELLDRAPEDSFRERAFAFGGSLATIAVTLESAYRISGAGVRDAIWALHAFIREDDAPAIPQLEPYSEWLRAELRRDNESARKLQSIVFRWIDVASERLTMRRYHRADHLRGHAATLIAAPVQWLLESVAGHVVQQGRDDLAAISELILRYWDFADSERQLAAGHNRIVRRENEQIGGFYGVAESFQTPATEEIAESMRQLANDALDMQKQVLSPASAALNAIYSSLPGAIARAVEARESRGKWPKAWEIPPRKTESSVAGWLARIFKN